VRIALRNLQSAFPDKPDRELHRIVSGVYRNLARNAVDVVRCRQMIQRIELTPETRNRLDDLRQHSLSGKPLIFVTGHFGNWEILGQYLSTWFPGIGFLAKAQHNPRVDRYLNELRLSFGGQIVPSHRAPRELSRFLRQGRPLLFVADQDGGADGVFVRFVGRQTSYARGPALYAYHYDAPVVPVFLCRAGRGYCLHIGEIVIPDRDAKKTDEVPRIIQSYSDSLEHWVRLHPEQWLWTHRRWRSVPTE
jgi:KDO2-lipid IV(A) lauroyltransferase